MIVKCYATILSHSENYGFYYSENISIKGGVIMPEIKTEFKNINKVTLAELDDALQYQIGLIDGMHEDLGGIYPGATKVENLGGGKLRINDVEVTVYAHPATHPVSMITGLADVAISGDYNDLSNTPKSLPASDVYEWAKQPTKPKYTAEEVNAIPKSMKGTSNGVAELNELGKVPTAQLPDNLTALIETGFLPKDQIPVLDITTHLKDNSGTTLILGGLTPLDII